MKSEELIPVARLVEPLTVVLATHNQADALRRHLPAILSQDHDQFEVIVVDTGSIDDTLAILEVMEMQYNNLRHLCTPASARDISLERLALTLGIRAAQSEWVLLTEADCEPATNHCLTIIGKNIQAHPEADIVMGFSRYDEQRNSWFDHQIGFHRLWHQLGNYRHILSGHAAVRGDGCNVAVRKSLFMSQGGFASHQNLKTGACDLMVNHFSTPNNTCLCLEPHAAMIQDRPTPQQWQQQQVFYMETRRHQRHTFLYRLRNIVSLSWPWFEFLFMAIPFLVGLVMLIMCLYHDDASYIHPLTPTLSPQLSARPAGMLDPSRTVNTSTVNSSDIIIFSLFLLLILTAMILISTLRIRQFNKQARKLGCRTYRLTFIIHELAMPFRAARAWLCHRFASKNEFRKNFV